MSELTYQRFTLIVILIKPGRAAANYALRHDGAICSHFSDFRGLVEARDFLRSW